MSQCATCSPARCFVGLLVYSLSDGFSVIPDCGLLGSLLTGYLNKSSSCNKSNQNFWNYMTMTQFFSTKIISCIFLILRNNNNNNGPFALTGDTVTIRHTGCQKTRTSKTEDCLLAPDLIPTGRTRMYSDNFSLFFSFLSLSLCLCFRRLSLHVRLNDASRSTTARERKSLHSLVLVLPSLSRTCKRDDTRRLCFRRTSLHIGFLVLMFASYV